MFKVICFKERNNPYIKLIIIQAFKGIHLGRFAGNGGGGVGSSSGAKSSKKNLTKKSVGVRMSKKERKLVNSEVNPYYNKRYNGKNLDIYYYGTYGKMYKFNINGFNNYQFISAKKIK